MGRERLSMTPLHAIEGDLPAPTVNEEVFRYELAARYRVLRPVVGEATELLQRVPLSAPCETSMVDERHSIEGGRED
jgi:hypothetical protein